MNFKGVDFRVSTVKNNDGSTEIYFEHVSNWDDFDLVVGLLQQENNCMILSNQEAVYMRVAELSLNGLEFFVKHDDMLGNFLYTENPQSVPILERLANNVIESIKKKLKEKGLF